MSDIERVIFDDTKRMIAEKFSRESTGHDYWHMERVWALAKEIAADEKDVDMDVLELAVWLHDLADHKFHDGDMEAGPRAVHEWLQSLGVDGSVDERVQNVIRTSSYTATLESGPPQAVEARILHDADKLDALGAIGVARAFAYGGMKGRSIHNPTIEPNANQTAKQYKNSQSGTVNHFYEKLLKLKDMMLTEKGKHIAQSRHEFMQQFLDEFLAEWDGDK